MGRRTPEREQGGEKKQVERRQEKRRERREEKRRSGEMGREDDKGDAAWPPGTHLAGQLLQGGLLLRQLKADGPHRQRRAKASHSTLQRTTQHLPL